MARLRALLPLLATLHYGACLSVMVSNSGPAVRGANITFTAIIDGYNGEELYYSWYDNAQPQHRQDFTLTSKTCNWTVSYPRDLYEAREYKVDVEVEKQLVIWYKVASNSTYFNVTDELNGELSMSQNNTRRPNEFVAANETVEHMVEIGLTDLTFLQENATSIQTYWFLDCNYLGITSDYKFIYKYPDALKDHTIEALVVATTQPLPPIPTTTAPTTTSSTTTTTTTTPKPPVNASTELPNPSQPTTQKSSNENKKVSKREVRHGVSLPSSFICDTAIVPYDPKNIYGHYKKTISIREPIANISVSGNNWLPHGELLVLQFKCRGSPPFNYCTRYIEGAYNRTGNETCRGFVTTTQSCDFPIIHYFSDIDLHTTLIIIENQLGKSVWPVAINIYEVKKTGQLSVIVVPVAFCLVAAILVVFGVAYYIQSRSRYTIEVANFDFGQQYSHLDYKTFMERLRDSFNNALNLTGVDEENPSPSTSNNKYGSMT